MNSSDRQPIKILHVLYVMRMGGGVENWLLNILRRIDRSRFQIDFLVHVLYPSAYSEEIEKLGSKILLCPHPRQFVWQPWAYSRTFKKIVGDRPDYDIIHTHVAHFNGYILYLAKQLNIPIRIAHSHDDASVVERSAPLPRRLYISFTKALILKYATMGLAASYRAARYMFGSNWKNDPRWQLLYYGIDLTNFAIPVDSQAVRSQFKLSENSFVIGHVGRFAEQKNQLFLLEIVAECLKLEPHTRLLLVGDGPLQKDIAAKAQALGLEDYVIFAGERTDVAQLMQGAMDVFLLPSLHEGLGIVLIEAQAAELPCIFSDVVPEEVDVIKSLMQRISLTASASVWAEATLKARSLKEKLDRPSILTSLEHSQFNIEVSSKKLAEVYESKSSHY